MVIGGGRVAMGGREGDVVGVVAGGGGGGVLGGGGRKRTGGGGAGRRGGGMGGSAFVSSSSELSRGVSDSSSGPPAFSGEDAQSLTWSSGKG